MSKVVEVVEALVRPIAEAQGLEVVEVEYVKEGRDWFLRVFIDNEAGIDIDECVSVSEKLSQLLDEQDPIPDQYFLEVSSPGAERPLKKKADFEAAIGKNVHIKTYEPIEDCKEHEGIMLSFSETVVVLEVKVKTAIREIEIPYEKIAKARLAIVF